MFDSPFYVTLPSDASMEQYPRNNAAEWTTKLKNAISLKGRWEVALVEMQYMNSLSTLAKQQRMIVKTITHVNLTQSDNDKMEYKTKDHVITFPAGHYSSAGDLLRVIKKGTPELIPVTYPEAIEREVGQCRDGKAFCMELESETDHRIRVTLASPRVHIFFPPDSAALQKLLGFDHSDIYAQMICDRRDDHVENIARQLSRNLAVNFQLQPLTAPRPMNALLGNQSLFMYCNIADYSFIGDTAAQILRTVPIKGQFMQLVTERFDVPHYTPVLINRFETVNVHICTDLGDTAKFATGKTLVKLHFRPLRPY